MIRANAAAIAAVAAAVVPTDPALNAERLLTPPASAISRRWPRQPPVSHQVNQQRHASRGHRAHHVKRARRANAASGRPSHDRINLVKTNLASRGRAASNRDTTSHGRDEQTGNPQTAAKIGAQIAAKIAGKTGPRQSAHRAASHGLSARIGRNRDAPRARTSATIRSPSMVAGRPVTSHVTATGTATADRVSASRTTCRPSCASL